MINYSDIKKRYENFINPTFEIQIEGRTMSDCFTVKSAEVELTTETEETSSARLEIYSVESESKGIDAQCLLSEFPLMGKIKIGFGYGGSNKTVFEGIIFVRELNIKGFMSGGLTVSCLDLKALLRLNNAFTTYSVKSCSKLLESIVSKYGLSIKAGGLPKFDKPVTFIQNGNSDFDFIANLAHDLDCEFFVLNKDVYFRKITSVNENLITLDSDAIYSVSHRTSMAGLFSAVEVLAHNQDKNEENSASCKSVSAKIGKGNTASEILKINGYDLVMYERRYISNKVKTDVHSLAESRLQNNSLRLTELLLRTDGLPELVPGKFITVKDVAAGIDNTYYLKTVRHVFDKNYRTEHECCSNTTEF